MPSPKTAPPLKAHSSRSSLSAQHTRLCAACRYLIEYTTRTQNCQAARALVKTQTPRNLGRQAGWMLPPYSHCSRAHHLAVRVGAIHSASTATQHSYTTQQQLEHSTPDGLQNSLKQFFFAAPIQPLCCYTSSHHAPGAQRHQAAARRARAACSGNPGAQQSTPHRARHPDKH